mmetsp:Transcript_23569/g.37549  ORF Transcript_23569/g.37549 Transcript_23569/m.37549 type:complete len:120 (-) Transcript_23569:1998-2357(-)
MRSFFAQICDFELDQLVIVSRWQVDQLMRIFLRSANERLGIDHDSSTGHVRNVFLCHLRATYSFWGVNGMANIKKIGNGFKSWRKLRFDNRFTSNMDPMESCGGTGEGFPLMKLWLLWG